jgi:trk system potassium uptake protein
MRVIIAGGGRTGAHLARLLLNQNINVTVIEHRKEVLSRIHRELPTESIFEGDPIDPVTLDGAGIYGADALAATTTDDEKNLVLCYIARSKYNIDRTIARVNNPRNAWLFDQKFNVDVAVDQAEILGRLIEEEMAMGDMLTLMKLKRGNYSLVEEKVAQGASSIGIPIKDLGLPDQCVIAAVIRSGVVLMPRGQTSFQTGDEVLAVTDADGARQLSRLLQSPGNGNGAIKPANGNSKI